MAWAVRSARTRDLNRAFGEKTTRVMRSDKTRDLAARPERARDLGRALGENT